MAIGIGIGLPWQRNVSLSEWASSPTYALDSVELYSMVGEEFNLYGDSLINVPIKNYLSVTYISSVGSSVDNNYSFTPQSSDIGRYSILVQFKEKGRTFLQKIIYLNVLSKVPVGAKKILLIGDSTMSSGGSYYCNAIKSLLNNSTLTFVGTIGTSPNLFEGYAGARWYGFITGNYGKFYKNGALDIASYFTDHSIDVPDYIYIRLGINDTFGTCIATGDKLTPAEIATIINNAKILIDGFLNYNSDLKIILGIPTICEDSGAGWANNYDETLYLQDWYIENMHKYWSTFLVTFKDGVYNTRVDCSYEVLNLDRNDGYPKTNGIHTNGVHPSSDGYTQLGNGMAFYFNKEITQSLIPSEIATTWVDDYLQLSFTDNTSNVAQHEIYESEDGVNYTLLTTLNAGVTSYNHTSVWQNKTLHYKIRAKIDTWYSDYSSVANTTTPLVFISDQTSLNTLTVQMLNITTGKTVNIDWGDGTNNNYTGNNSTITKNYSTTGVKYVKLSGDINSISNISITNQVNISGNLTKWNRPTSLVFLNIISCKFTGDWSNNKFINGLTTCTITQSSGAGISGDWSNFILNNQLSNFSSGGNFGYKATGDLSSWIIPVTCTRLYIRYNLFTDLPRGEFKNLDSTFGLYADGNSVNQTKLDDFLLDLLNYYQSTTPIKNQLYKLDGATMGKPSATGLSYKSQIETIFINAGFTVTINVNS